MRTKLKKQEQKEFLKKVMASLNAPSLRELSKRIDTNYSTMKNYYSGSRLLPKELYENLAKISEVKKQAKFINKNWGQVKGGKKKN